MILAHVTGWSLQEIKTMKLRELHKWTHEAVGLWNELHKPPDKT